MNKLLSCDWGTTSFRLRLVDLTSGGITAQSGSDEGIANTYAQWQKTGSNENERVDCYLTVMQKHIKVIERNTKSSADNIPLVISGMASATVGMVELPYAQLPFSLDGSDLQYQKITSVNAFLHDVLVISGASTNSDVMRGEETQLIGAAAQMAGAPQIFIFPGTHSKHITTVNGKAVDIVTYMTGEFFELLVKKSILSDSITTGVGIATAEDKVAFEQGVADSCDQNLLHHSFMVRTNQLFKRFSKTANYFYLSGLLTGTELTQLTKIAVPGITIVANRELLSNYLLALDVLKIQAPVTAMDAATATIQGQLIVYRGYINR